MTVPTSIERLEPFPEIAIALLHRIPIQFPVMPDFRDLIEKRPHLLGGIHRVAMQSGRVAAETEPASLFDQVEATALAEIAVTLLLRDYMEHAFAIADDRRYWRYTLASAVCCQLVAGPSQQTLLAYACGLLHDIGRLAFIATYPDRYSNLLTLTDRMFASGEDFDILERERLLFGMDHFAAGGWLAAVWKMPPWLRAIVGKFDKAAGEYSKLVETVRSGTRLAHSLGFGYLQAAPRANVRDILSSLPPGKPGDSAPSEKRLRDEIQSRLSWYANAESS